jgi:acetyltransferase-like isoleucine patch superfamily enzyme
MIVLKRWLTHTKQKLKNSMLTALVQMKNPTCNIYPGVIIGFNSKLGKYVVLFKDVSLHNATIGDYSYVQKQSAIGNADIGKFCSIAGNVLIGPGQHPIDFVSTHPAFYSPSQQIPITFATKEYFDLNKRTIIGNDVWIGQYVVLMDGIRVGNGAVIASGAIVTKDVPDYAIVGGMPASVIKYRFEEPVIRKLLESKWWDNDQEWFTQNAQKFLDWEEFIRNDK